MRTREEAMFMVSRRGPAMRAAILAGAAVAFMGAVPVAAEELEKVPKKEPIAVRVQVIAATSEEGEAPGADVDARLEELRNRLSDFAFSTYRLMEEKSLELVLESSQSMSLPGGRELRITPKRFEESGKLRVHLLVKSHRKKNLVDADYSIEPGGDILVGGMRLRKGGALMVAIHHGK